MILGFIKQVNVEIRSRLNQFVHNELGSPDKEQNYSYSTDSVLMKVESDCVQKISPSLEI